MSSVAGADERVLPGGFYKALLDSLFDAVLTVDGLGRVTYWNESCERLTGYSAAEVVGTAWCERGFVAGSGAEEGKSPLAEGFGIVLESGSPGTWKGYVRRRSGQRVPVDARLSAIRGPKGVVMGAVAVLRDVSAHVALEQAHKQLLQMARQDRLTGLLNRAAIADLLGAEVERARRYGQPVAVVMVDVDHFKRINDRYGHDAGDLVLAKIAAVLKHNVREPDQVGRWGGEEFLVIAPGSAAAGAAEMAERLRGYVAGIPEGEVAERMTASFGVAELGEGTTRDELIYRADMALYAAKEGGRDRVRMWGDGGGA